MGRYGQNGRTGAFLAVNNGTVEGCVAEVSFSAPGNGAGFVYENNARISNSVSLRCIRGKRAKGFYVRNSGTITESGYLASRNARRKGKSGVYEYVFGNAELYIPDNTPKAEIRQKLGLDRLWKESSEREGLLPDFTANRQDVLADSDKRICIETADDLTDLIDSVNSGDKRAASAHYLLVNDINMKGARLAPIGDSERCPFSGKFDGNGKTICNFTVDCRDNEVGGFFGYTQNAEVANLALDYILKGSGSVTVGGMAGVVAGGSFVNCQVRLAMSTGMYSGGFCGKNSGIIRNCYAGGKLTPPVSVLPWLISCSAVLLALLITGSVILIKKLTGDVAFNPEVIDPNQVPVKKPSGDTDPPPAGTNRISLELNHEIYISASTMVGQMDYVNPHRSTQDVVIRLCISDATLKKAGYDLIACGVRTQAEMNAEDYVPEKAFTVLYRSQRLQIGYKLGYCKLSPLPNGETLKVGTYDMVMMIDAYDPKTNEKSIVNAQAETTIHVVDR